MNQGECQRTTPFHIVGERDLTFKLRNKVVEKLLSCTLKDALSQPTDPPV